MNDEVGMQMVHSLEQLDQDAFDLADGPLAGHAVQQIGEIVLAVLEHEEDRFGTLTDCHLASEAKEISRLASQH